MKNLLRSKMKGICKRECSETLVRLLKNTVEYKRAKNIMLFYPLKNEVNLLPLLEDCEKNFYLPRVSGDNLVCCPYRLGDELCFSSFKTQEPLSEPVNKNTIELVIVPALCCDKKNFRLGYGGGFYDRFLKDFNGKKIVCIPKELIVDTVYPEKYDVPVDLVISC